MRLLMAMTGLAMACASVPAQAQWREVEGGMQHEASGLVCPSAAGEYGLAAQVATDHGFSCRYRMLCADAATCGAKAGDAALVWNPALDFDARFRELAQRQGIAVIDEQGPDWAGVPKLYAHGPDVSGGWWQLQPGGKPLNLAIFYSDATAPDAKLLVEAVVRANP